MRLLLRPVTKAGLIMKSIINNKHPRLIALLASLVIYGYANNVGAEISHQEVNNKTRNILSNLFQPKANYETAAQTAEIWSRLRSRLHLGSNQSAQPLFQRHVKSFAKHQDYINMVVRNASPYLYYILEEVEKRGMPSEIALLPIIESDFNPHTLSNRGALGLWQLMPALGKMHGLKQNAWYDGRKDVYESTKAALDHLQYLHKKFNGNWLLAIAAYNCGETRILREMKKNKSAQKSTEFWALKLPKETMNFVPKLLAFAAIVKTPQHYGVVLPAIPNKPVIARVHTSNPIDIAHAAKLVDISETQLRKLNPGLKKSASPKGPFHLVVPVQHAEHFQQKIGGKAPSAPQGPRLVESAKAPSSSKKDKKQSSAQTTSTLNDVTVVKGSKPAKAKQPQKYHTVKKGDSIPKIAKKYGIKEKTLFKNNHLTHKSIIHPGQKILLSSN